MLKRIVFFLAIGLIILLTAAYFNQTRILLAVAKYRATNEYDVGPSRELPWNTGPAVEKTAFDQRPPNIILIVADDLGYNDISTFGGGPAGGRVKTPNIDELAEQGAVFHQSYSGSATCAPSRAMLMTGRYPTRTGFEFTPMIPGMGKLVSRISSELNTGRPPGRYYPEIDEVKPSFSLQGLPSEELTIAEVLRDRGYATFHIGKWHLGRQNGMAAHDQGFDQSLLMAAGLYLPEDDPAVVNAKLDFDPIDKFLWAASTYANSFNTGDQDRFEPRGYLTDYWTEESIKVIKANKNRPFFLYLAHWGPHTPLQATREDYEAVGDIKPHRLRVYAAMIRAVDRSIGSINETLKAEGLESNTIVVFTSDNGGAGYIGIPDVNSPYRGWKMTNFEGGLRVPFFMKWPARIMPGTVLQQPVAHIDMMPTLLDAADVDLPEEVILDGLSVLPLATQSEISEWNRDTLFWQSGHYQMVRHKDWKLQIMQDPARKWLFNLAEDPTEQVNLADAEPAKVKELLSLLETHHAKAREPLYPAALEAAVTVDRDLSERAKDGDEFIYWPN